MEASLDPRFKGILRTCGGYGEIERNEILYKDMQKNKPTTENDETSLQEWTLIQNEEIKLVATKSPVNEGS